MDVCKLHINIEYVGSVLTDDTAGFYSVLVNLHQVVGQVAQFWLHALSNKTFS